MRRRARRCQPRWHQRESAEQLNAKMFSERCEGSEPLGVDSPSARRRLAGGWAPSGGRSSKRHMQRSQKMPSRVTVPAVFCDASHLRCFPASKRPDCGESPRAPALSGRQSRARASYTRRAMEKRSGSHQSIRNARPAATRCAMLKPSSFAGLVFVTLRASTAIGRNFTAKVNSLDSLAFHLPPFGCHRCLSVSSICNARAPPAA
jgi:hypothetical protein